jgi:transposase
MLAQRPLGAQSFTKGYCWGTNLIVSILYHDLEYVETVNHAFYKYVLERIRKRVQRVRKDIARNWVLHHDNTPSHTALSITEFLAKKDIPTLPQPPYSPDLAPCDFTLFPKLKSKLKGHHFGTAESIRKIVTNDLRTLTENDFRYCSDQWKERWNHYVTCQGSYFEGDNL